MEKSPLSRLERIKAEKEKYSNYPVKKDKTQNAGKVISVPEKEKKGLSEKSINLIADALKMMLKEQK